VVLSTTPHATYLSGKRNRCLSCATILNLPLGERLPTRGHETHTWFTLVLTCGACCVCCACLPMLRYMARGSLCIVGKVDLEFVPEFT